MAGSEDVLHVTGVRGVTNPIGKAYRPDIDGLRALAVSSVVAYHYGVPFVAGGFAGVDVFFVISGYLIGAIIFRDVRAGRFSFAAFYARRARRILPALFATLTTSGVAAWALLTPDEMGRFSHDAANTILGVSNFGFWLSSGYFSPAAAFNPLLMTWSLGVEEQFYLLFPILMLQLARLRGSRILLLLAVGCLISLTLSVWFTHTKPTPAFYLLPTRAWELGVGTLLAVREIGASRSETIFPAFLRDLSGWAGLALLTTAMLTLNARTPFPGVAAALPVGGAALVILGKGGFLNRTVFASRSAVFVGLVSYSWYLWHWPLLSFARIATDEPLTPTVSAALAVASFAAAVLSWRFVERPFRAPGSTSSSTLLRFGGVGVVVLVAALLLSVNGGWRDRFDPALEAVEAQTRLLQSDPCLAGYGVASPNRSPACVPDDEGRPTLALLGDSHAAALAGALRKVAEAQGMAFLQLTKSACPLLANVTRRMPNHPGHEQECAAFEAETLQIVRERPSIRAVVLAGYWSAALREAVDGAPYVMAAAEGAGGPVDDSPANLRRGLDDLLATLAAHGRRITLFQDVPDLKFDPVRRFEAALIPARSALAYAAGDAIVDPNTAILTHVQIDDARAIVAQVAAMHPDVVLIDPWREFCDRERCQVGDSSNLYYADSHHLSLAGAKRVIRNL